MRTKLIPIAQHFDAIGLGGGWQPSEMIPARASPIAKPQARVAHASRRAPPQQQQQVNIYFSDQYSYYFYSTLWLN
jgi:hypothetical protein|tara:strand:- start:780 stop:1007 length:228 start_codon:yes stop_codon:yes gene_type:complete